MRFAVIGARGFPSTYGGFETFVRHLAPGLRERGHDVTVYCRRMRGSDARIRTVEGVRCIDPPGVDSKSLSTMSYSLTASVDAVARRFDAALVLNCANGFYLPILEAARIPTVMNVDGIEWERGKWGAVARTAFKSGARVAARSATTLIADSEAIADYWSNEFGRRPVFIPYGANVLNGLGDGRVRAVGANPGRYVLVVARLVPENNVDLTVDAIQLMKPKPQLVVVGEANYRSSLEGRLADLERHGTVRWLRHVHDQQLLRELWRHCGVYVHGHSVGGTNPALLEALGAGAPTLALETPYNREVLGDTTQLFSTNPHDLAREIESVLTDERHRTRLATYGPERIRERYLWEPVIDRYTEELEIAARSRGRRL